MALKAKFRTVFPALVSVGSPLTLVKTGLAYAFGIDIDALRESLDPFYAPLSILNEPTIVTGSSATIAPGTAAVAINRAAPAATALVLPSVAAQGGIPIRILDWSTAVTAHAITITPNGSETIMRQASWPMYSNSASLASLTLYPSTTLNGWYMAP